MFDLGLAMYLESRFRTECMAHGAGKGARGFWFCNFSFRSNPEQKFRRLAAKPIKTTMRKVLEMNTLRARMQIAKMESANRADAKKVAKRQRQLEAAMAKLIAA